LKGYALLLILLLYAGRCLAQQPSDLELFEEGRVALDIHKDCKTAQQAFMAESRTGKDSPIWLDYAARVAECLNDLPTAVSYYELELAKLPGTSRLMDKIGELRYKIQLDANASADQARAQAQQLVQQQQLLAEQAQASQIARTHLAETYREIADFINLNYQGQDQWRVFHDKKKLQLKRTLISLDDCVLRFREEFKGGYNSERDVDLFLSGARVDEVANMSSCYDMADDMHTKFNSGTCFVPVYGGPGSTESVTAIEIPYQRGSPAPKLGPLLEDAASACHK
jgi:hypothetical protein